MDLLNDHIAERGKTGVSMSNFFKKKTGIIQEYCNQLEPENRELDLKRFWLRQIDLFAEQNPNLRVTKDYYLIDFIDFKINRIKHLDNNRIKGDVAQTRVNAVNDILQDNVFQDTKMGITNLIIINKFKAIKQSLSHVLDMHKKDLLYYDIIDLVTTSKRQSVYKVLDEAQIKEYTKSQKSKFVIQQEIVSFTKSILDLAKITSLKQALKDTKKTVNLLSDNTIKAERQRIYKIVKVFAALLDDGNKLNGYYNGMEYTFFFLFPILK